MKPHIIIFNPDEFRLNGLSHMGNKGGYTPVLDTLVEEEAVSFSSAFCQNPVCTPSRCSFMTGWYPHVFGHRTMGHMLHSEKGEESLLKILKENGYNVWWGGKNDLVPAQNGFEQDCDIKFKASPELLEKYHAISQEQVPHDETWRGNLDGDNYYSFYQGVTPEKTEDGKRILDNDWLNVYGALDYIEKYDGKSPFVLYLPLSFPHPPYRTEASFYAHLDEASLPPRIPTLHDGIYGKKPQMLKEIMKGQHLQGWSEERFRTLRRTYYAMCARIDYQAGLLIDALKKKKLWDDSLFLFFSDHGDFAGDYGIVEKNQNTFEDAITNVPLIVKLPGSQKKTGIDESLVELIDVSETIYDLTHIPKRYWTFGKSLVPLIQGTKDEIRSEVHCEGGRLPEEKWAREWESYEKNGSDPQKGQYYPRIRAQQMENPLFHGKGTMIRTKEYKYVRRLNEEDELYDLRRDPCEEENIIEDPQYHDICLEMKERLLTWYQSTCDIVPFSVDQRF